MTNREAIAGEIEPYSLSDDSIEKAFIDASFRYNISAEVDDDYDATCRLAVAWASVLCLNRLRTLSSENIGGISNSYNENKLVARIKSIANNAGFSVDSLIDSDDPTIEYVAVW